jgi:GTP cyclohydrolase I
VSPTRKREERGGSRGRPPGPVPDLVALERFLRSLGLDPARDPEYAETVELAGTFLTERTAGLREEPRPLRAIPYRGRPGAVIALEDLPVYGLCPHHFVPWFGTASVRFVPERSLCGAGSLARVVRALALVPRLQEDFTEAVADAIDHALKPRSVAVHVEARHLCIEMRGVEQRARLVTEARRGQPLETSPGGARGAARS